MSDLLEITTELINNKIGIPQSPNGKRIIPHDLIRSSLFTVVNKNIKRDYLKEKRLNTFGTTEITYTGEELRQDDEDVWMQILYHYSRSENSHIEFSPYSFLRAMDWPQRTQYRDKLFDSLNRLSASNIAIYNTNAKIGLSLSLVRKFQWRDDDSLSNTKSWKIWLEPELINLFENKRYSKIVWEQRKMLSPLAKWLHSFYSSHFDPYPISVERIKLVCGSKTKSLRHFRESLKNSLFELRKVGFLEDYLIDRSDKIIVVRIFKNNALHYYGE